jgi:starch phosphorylase
MFPSYKVHAITNGVHPQTWTNDHFKHLYDQHFLGWQHQPEQLVRIDQVPQDALWQAHMQSKQQLFDLIYAQTGVQLDIALPTIGFARRMTAYKRADLIFSDIEKLKTIAKKQPFQLVFAGKAHPSDQKGKEIIAEIHAHITALASDIKMVYLSGYDMRMGLALVSGVDVWLNTPLRPLEASGTSGMKASFNGVPSFSILDGWWLEGYIEGVTGWAIGHHENNGSEDDAKDLYEKLEHIVLPLYDNKEAWQNVMKGAIGRNASFFNTHRMIRRYATEAYML